MCRYAFSGPYRRPYACFGCRKVFHATMEWDKTKAREVDFLCPECKQPMHSMGLDFKAPKQHDIRQWRKVKLLFENGFAYGSCGCGPGTRPKQLSEVKPFLEDKARQREQMAVAQRNAASRHAKEAKLKERKRQRYLKNVKWSFYPLAEDSTAARKV